MSDEMPELPYSDEEITFDIEALDAFGVVAKRAGNESVWLNARRYAACLRELLERRKAQQ